MVFRPFVVACCLAFGVSAHAADDAEVRQWLNEFVGSSIVLQELAAGHCSEFLRGERGDIDRSYAWGAALASPDFRVQAERSKAQVIAQARSNASRWVANEFRSVPDARRLQRTCGIYAGMFRTIRDAAETELEDIEYRQKGRVTPRRER
ncbi:MAG TPA: hypothetical protein VHL79_04415 [Ramlibacter sp.]|jgi:hypothetical protein|nr:hypothetical protein [Ramlibacter sp.]